jgi:hypothetical protein
MEDLVRPLVRMETDALSVATRVERQLGPVLVDLLGRHDRWIGYVALAEPAERVAYQRASVGELGLIVEVLQLAAAAIVSHVVGTAWFHPVG